MTNVTDVPISDFIMTEFFQKKLDDYKKKNSEATSNRVEGNWTCYVHCEHM
jgi:hypothetical protein